MAARITVDDLKMENTQNKCFILIQCCGENRCQTFMKELIVSTIAASSRPVIFLLISITNIFQLINTLVNLSYSVSQYKM